MAGVSPHSSSMAGVPPLRLTRREKPGQRERKAGHPEQPGTPNCIRARATAPARHSVCRYMPSSMKTDKIVLRSNIFPGQHRGAIAQLGERIVRNDEVVGSSPTSSTMFSITWHSFLFELRSISFQNFSEWLLHLAPFGIQPYPSFYPRPVAGFLVRVARRCPWSL